MEWVTKHGVGLEKDYKYKSINRMPGEENSCKSDLNRGVRAYVKQYAIVQPTVEGIKEALKYSTVAVGIDGTEVGLLGYRSGVYGDRQEEVEGCKDKPLNHAVLIVGYGTDDNGEYWRVRNSWGDQWGEKGFFRVRILSGDGVCGINKNPSVVLSSRYSKSPPPMSTSPITDEGIGVQNICAVALGVMGIVSLILGCGCGESQPEAPYPSNQYTKSPAFLYGAVERLERRREDKAKAKNIAKASPRWLGGGLGVYQNIDSTPPDSRGGTPAGRGERTRSEDEESGLLQHHMRASSFGHLGDNSGVQPPNLTGTTSKKGKSKKKKKKKLQMGIGFVPGGLGGKGLIDSNISVDKGSPSPTF